MGNMQIKNLIDLTGKRYGRLVVQGLGSKKGSQHTWKCICDCGNIKEVKGCYLRNGQTKSCGCLKKEFLKDTANPKKIHTKHNGTHTRLHRIWLKMRNRCNNPNNDRYASYGGRGIRVCDEWSGENGFVNFRDWALENGYDDSLSIDRINVDGNYEPSNCRWATVKMQARNKRNSRNFTIDGKNKNIAEWCEIYGINENNVRSRIKLGWTIEEALEIVERKGTV